MNKIPHDQSLKILSAINNPGDKILITSDKNGYQLLVGNTTLVGEELRFGIGQLKEMGYIIEDGSGFLLTDSGWEAAQ